MPAPIGANAAKCSKIYSNLFKLEPLLRTAVIVQNRTAAYTVQNHTAVIVQYRTAVTVKYRTTVIVQYRTAKSNITRKTIGNNVTFFTAPLASRHFCLDSADGVACHRTLR